MGKESFMSSLLELSNSLADTVAAAGESIVAINSGTRKAPSGIHWHKGIVITSDESLPRHEDLSIVGANGKVMPIKLLGRDPSTDLAVFSLADAESLAVATIGDSASLKVGHLVLGLARSGEGDIRAAMGTLSVLGGAWQSMSGGTIDRYIRPDLTLYRGFAGGALVDAAGRVVGMNNHGKHGTALTIPAALKLTVPTGVILIDVEPQSPAEVGGLLLGDILITWDGVAISDPGDVRALLNRGDRIGEQVKIGAIRGGVYIELAISIGER
jgi:S1-C subfamily serine protease